MIRYINILLLYIITFSFSVNAQKITNEVVNGIAMYDTQGNIINAHGGGFIKVGDFYYWIGENRKNGILVSCYRSKDLINWEFRGDLLTQNSHPELNKANIERPKIIYNEHTKQFVMWMHYEYNGNYNFARAAVAYSTDIEKPFTFIKSFRPFGNMSRDCTLYKDDDGTAYFLSSARDNYDLILYKLTDDFLDTKEQIATLFQGGHREAPTLVKRGKYYFLLTSGCTGWAPNQAKYAYSSSLVGPWSNLMNIGNETTYNSQSTYIVSVETKNSIQYLYVGDRWSEKHYHQSTYVFLPLIFPAENKMELLWKDNFISDLKIN